MMVNVVRFFKIVDALFCVAIVAACQGKKAGTSSVTIQLPSARSQKASSKSVSQSVSALSFDFTVACFAVNVTGPSIPQTGDPCEPPIGVASPFKPSGSTVTLEVPMGSSRKLEVFLFNRLSSTDPCPTDFKGFGPDKFSRVGQVDGIEMTQPETTVAVTIVSPAAGVNVATQYSLPGSCTAVANNGPTTQRVVLGSGRVPMSGGYLIQGQVTAIRTTNEISNANYKMYIGPKGL